MRVGSARRDGYTRAICSTTYPACSRRRHHRLRVVGTADLEHRLHAGLAHIQVDAFAHVLDGDQVGTAFGEDHQQSGEGAGRSLIRANRISRDPNASRGGG